MNVLLTHTDSKSPPQLILHLETTLRISADEARRIVNSTAVADLGTGLIAREPELLIRNEQIIWRVPIVLSLPTFGDIGQVGVIEVDAQTGKTFLKTIAQEQIRQHASRLYAGTTLQTE